MITADTLRLLAAIRRFPEEDTPRLALADEMQSSGFDGADAFVRFDVSDARSKLKKHTNIPAVRREQIAGYARWLEALFDRPPTDRNGGSGFYGLGWGDHWMYHVSDSRRCEMRIERGLPHVLTTTCPLLMDQAGKLFLFPLTECKVGDRNPERDDMIPGDTRHVWIASYYPQKYSSWEDEAHQIPMPLYNLLPRQEGERWAYLGRGAYSSRMHANSALRAAALAFGRAAVAEPACEVPV